MLDGGSHPVARSPLTRRVALRLVPPLAALSIRLIRRTMRLEHVGRNVLDDLRASGRPYIHAFWHGHLFLMPYSYSGRGITIVISAHQDGELIARTMKRFGHEAARGSTTSGGAAALRKAVRALRSGKDVGFTPDGPRGPRHRVQMGVIQAARMGGAPIVPVAFSASPRKIMRSWDGFILPWPFSRGVFVYGDPLEVSGRAGPGEMEAARLQLELRMHETAARAEALALGTRAQTSPMGTRRV